MTGSRARRAATEFASAFLSIAIATAGPAFACPQDQVSAFVRDLAAMSSKAETSIRYLVPRFRDCGQGAIASELESSPEWLSSMRQHLQAQANVPAELKITIETALTNLDKAESSLQKNYDLVLKGIDSMYDSRFPPKCRNERTQIVSNMKSTRPLVPEAIGKLNNFKTCLAN